MPDDRDKILEGKQLTLEMYKGMFFLIAMIIPEGEDLSEEYLETLFDIAVIAAKVFKNKSSVDGAFDIFLT